MDLFELYKVALCTLPTVDESVVKLKKELLPIIESHLAVIATVLQTRANTLSTTDIHDMTWEAAVHVFVDVSKCQLLLDARETARRPEIALVFSTCSTVCNEAICERTVQITSDDEEDSE